MKVIINNKLYDSANAEFICEHMAVVLFKTANGNYFTKSGDNIEALTIDEAKDFLGLADIDIYIKEFGDVEDA